MSEDKSQLLDTGAFKLLDGQAGEAQQEAHDAGGASVSGEISAGDLARAIGASSGDSNNVSANTTSGAGVMNQTILPNEIGAAGSSDNSDISGGDADVANKMNSPVK